MKVHKATIGTTAVTLVIQVIIIVFLVWGIIKGCNYVREEGLKSIVDEKWEGKK